MNAASRAGAAAFRHQEIAFSACMAAVAVLGRDNPAYSPGLMASFAVLLAFNLGYQVLLRLRGETWVVPMVSMAANAALVTWVLSLSGRADSPFWPMYLIPIFTACLYLEARHVVFAAAAAVAFLASQYLLSAEPGAPLRWTAAELTLKSVVLAASAAVTAGHAFRERRVRGELDRARVDLQKLSAELEAAEALRMAGRSDLSRFVAGLVYDCHGRLALIRGRASLLASDLDADSTQAADARSISETAGALSRLTADLLSILKEGDGPETLDLAPMIERVVSLFEPRLHARRTRLTRDLPRALPPVRAGAPHLQQALIELFEAALTDAADEGELTVRARAEDGRMSLSVSAAGGPGRAPDAALLCRLLESFGGTYEAAADGTSFLLLPVADAAPKR